jgi:hypothetical protein
MTRQHLLGPVPRAGEKLAKKSALYIEAKNIY